jgi:putative heme-binding domain-containing protein
MYGALYVVENLEEYLADEAGYLASHPLALEDELLRYIDRNTEWKFEDLAGSVTPLSHGRSFDVGKHIFKVANCVGCHRLNDEGQQLGPDLAKLDEKKRATEHILRSLLEPSKDIDEKFQSYTVVLDSGQVLTGMIVEESATQLELLIDPLAKRDPLVIEKSNIEERQKSSTSIMPVGLANKLTSEEILDLIAYIYARGDKQHELFASEHQH